MSKKAAAGTVLALIVAAALFAVISFARQNWGANQAPGAFESLIARWFLSGSLESQQSVPNPVAPTAENTEEGGKLYQTYCAVCHGQDGTGPAANRMDFYPPVPSLAPTSTQLTDSQMHAIITRGVRYTAMPSFAAALSRDQIWKIILWLRRLPSSAQNK